MSELLAMVVFAGLVLMLAYVHVGYPVLMAILGRKFPRPPKLAPSGSPPTFSVLLCVHNEAARIESRLQNLTTLSWPGPVEFIVVCDGCTDVTAEVARRVSPLVKVLEQPMKSGKPAGLNAAVSVATGDLLVFCDARQTFAHDAIQHLAAPFSDPEIGAVSGSLQIAGSEAGGGQGVDLYWRLEKKLREWEGLYSSVVGCTGAIYALRRELYLPLPADTLLDDVVLPMQAVMQGKRVLFNPAARAFDPQTLDPEVESRRKLRTLAGNYQMLVRHPAWMLPGRCPIWWQVISHKYLRLAVPWMLGLLLVVTAILIHHPLFLAAFAAQVSCYTLAATGMLFPGIKHKAFSIPAGFILLQTANLRALFAWLASLKDPNRLWQQPPARRSPPPNP
ncbi:glycosyltransferase family 2 protein [Verrucomicrobium spinosum]|uniref:glycosyltransferase family 2 protein n=1 Tax=Verrucomicrobium spinosum TaxID=2736 RepID=UPI000174687C|nr:glycosyltransferase family 2 protein [Verrucomicrobium spinosum]